MGLGKLMTVRVNLMLGLIFVRYDESSEEPHHMMCMPPGSQGQ